MDDFETEHKHVNLGVGGAVPPHDLRKLCVGQKRENYDEIALSISVFTINETGR